MTQAAEYILSSYSFIATYSLEQILDVGYQSKEGNPIPSFDEKLLIELCADARKTLENESNILDIEGDVIIVGDIHGSFHDLLRILKYTQKIDSKVLFLGDYVDRGNFSLECITLLFALKITEPDKYFLLRGNHEFDSICSQYGFLDEIINYHNPKKVKESNSFQFNEKLSNSDSFNFLYEQGRTSNSFPNSPLDDVDDEYSMLHKEKDCYHYSQDLYDAFLKAFSYLPIAAIVNKTNLCIHGGLGPDLENINQIRNNIVRPISEFEESRLFSDLVWSDPCIVCGSFYAENPRGRGWLFSKLAAIHFLSENSLKRIIRAHECVKHGTTYNFQEKCVTVFSASSYSKEFGNYSGIVKLFQKDDSIKFVTFPPLRRLEKSDTIYYKVQAFHDRNEKIRLCFSFRHPLLPSNSSVRMTRHKSVRHINCQSSFLMQSPIKQPFKPISGSKSEALIQKPMIHHSNSRDCLNSGSEMQLKRRKTLNSLDGLQSSDDQ